MPRPIIRAFAADDIPAAARLLAQRHAEQLRAEPIADEAIIAARTLLWNPPLAKLIRPPAHREQDEYLDLPV